ncbi:hypothetical protein M6B38_287780 [Iris pallida]|uniref:Uncharacterized protein n=1 Tax=Iris pallida TaxID=29817 RepID=A0AAX6HXF0_IRIPA|nr:hypothetical protein M6B38_287780 [Iris pallida]
MMYGFGLEVEFVKFICLCKKTIVSASILVVYVGLLYKYNPQPSLQLWIFRVAARTLTWYQSGAD